MRARTSLVGSLALALALTGALVAAPAGAAGTVVLDQAHLDTSVPGTVAFDVDLPLADTGTPELRAAGTVSMTLLVDFDGDGNADGSLVAAPSYDAWALSGGEQFVQDAAPADTSLAGWRSAFPHAEALTAGWKGAVGDVDRATVGSTTYSFTNTVRNHQTHVEYSSDINRGLSGTRGHSDVRMDGSVRVWTEGASSADLAIGTVFASNLPLRDTLNLRLGQTNVAGAAAATELMVDLDGDYRVDAVLVSDDGQDYWLVGGTRAVQNSAPDHAPGSGSPNHGLLAEWRAKFPSATVYSVGWRLGPSVFGDDVIDRVDIGFLTYTFSGVNRLPSAYDLVRQVHTGQSIDVSGSAEDPDYETVTYSYGTATHGTYDPVTRQFTPDAGFIGEATVPYRAVDARGGVSNPATITIQVYNSEPITEFMRVSTPYHSAVTITLPYSDSDGDPLTFAQSPAVAPWLGSSEIIGNQLRFTPARGVTSTVNVPYTVSDGYTTSANDVLVDVGPMGGGPLSWPRDPTTISVRRLNHSNKFHTYEFWVLAPDGGLWAGATGGTLSVSLGNKLLYSQPMGGTWTSVSFGRTGRKQRRFTVAYSGNQYLQPSSTTIVTKSRGPGNY